jgi:hypothetical protein
MNLQKNLGLPTYHVIEAKKRYILLWSLFYENDISLRNIADVTGGKPIAVWSQSISGVSAINRLVAFYDIHGWKREVLFFYFVLDTRQDYYIRHVISK